MSNERFRSIRLVSRAWAHDRRLRTRKGWFLRMGGPINTKVASLIVHGKNVLGLEKLSDSFYGGLATAPTSLSGATCK